MIYKYIVTGPIISSLLKTKTDILKYYTGYVHSLSLDFLILIKHETLLKLKQLLQDK